jgi:hypothetical protein
MCVCVCVIYIMYYYLYFTVKQFTGRFVGGICVCIMLYNVVMCLCVCVICINSCHRPQTVSVLPIIIEGQFQVFQRFSSSELVLKAVESCFVALDYYGNGSICTSLSSSSLAV